MINWLKGFMNFTSREKDDRYWGGSVNPTAAGINVSEDNALTYSACWAATRVLSGTGSMLPFHLYKRMPSDARERDSRHLVAKLLRQPNKTMRAMQFRAIGINWQVNAGNFYAEIQRDNANRPYGLWPIHPSRVKIYEQKETTEAAEEGDLIYRVTNDGGREPTMLHMSDVLHVPSIITKDGVRGLGVIDAAREAIALGLSAEKQGNRTFSSGGMPSVVFTGMKFANEEAKAAFRRDWQSLYGTNGERAAFLEKDPANVHMLPFNAEEQQFLESRQFSVTEISRFYGVPPHLLADLMRATFSNIEQQSLEFVMYSLLPWLELWEQEIDAKLLSIPEQEKYFTQHVVEGLLRGDSAARSEFYTKMIQAGIMTPNRAAILENFDTYEAGDQHFMQAQMTPVEKLGMEPPTPPAPPEPAQNQPDSTENRRLRAQLKRAKAKAARIAKDRDYAQNGWLAADTRLAQVTVDAKAATELLQARLNSEHSTLEKAQEANRNLVARVAKVQADIAAKDAEIERLNADVSGLSLAIDKRDENISAIRAESAALADKDRAEILRLTSANARAEARVLALESAIAEKSSDDAPLKARIDQLQAELEAERTAKGKADAALERYKTQTQESAATIGKLEAKADSLKEDYSAASKMLTTLTEERDLLAEKVRQAQHIADSASQKAKAIEKDASSGLESRKQSARTLAESHLSLVFDRAIRNECAEVRRAAKHGTQSFKGRIDDAYHKIRAELLDSVAGVGDHYEALTGHRLNASAAVESHIKLSRKAILDTLSQSNDANLATNVRKLVENWTERAGDSSAVAFTNGAGR